MKKILFAMSIIAFVWATVVCFVYSPIVGVVVGIVSAMLIWVDWYLVKNNARWRTIIAIFILALILAFFAGTRIGKMRADIRQVEYEEATEETTIFEEFEAEVTESVEVEDDNGQQNIEDAVTTTAQEPVIVEKHVIVEKVVEVPVEKIVEKIVEVEVPKIEYVEVEKEVSTQVFDTTTLMPVAPPSLESITSSTPNYNYGSYNGYYGDPTETNYGNGYYGDPTGLNYGNGYYGDPTGLNYGNGYYGDPTGSNYYNNNYNMSNSTIKIKGEDVVITGEEYTYTISGVKKISESKLYIPEGIKVVDITGNEVMLKFSGVGAYWFSYGNAKFFVEAYAN